MHFAAFFTNNPNSIVHCHKNTESSEIQARGWFFVPKGGTKNRPLALTNSNFQNKTRKARFCFHTVVKHRLQCFSASGQDNCVAVSWHIKKEPTRLPGWLFFISSLSPAWVYLGPYDVSIYNFKPMAVCCLYHVEEMPTLFVHSVWEEVY